MLQCADTVGSKNVPLLSTTMLCKSWLCIHYLYRGEAVICREGWLCVWMHAYTVAKWHNLLMHHRFRWATSNNYLSVWLLEFWSKRQGKRQSAHQFNFLLGRLMATTIIQCNKLSGGYRVFYVHKYSRPHLWYAYIIAYGLSWWKWIWSFSFELILMQNGLSEQL